MSLWVSKCLGLQKIQVESRQGARACVGVSAPANVFCNVYSKRRGGREEERRFVRSLEGEQASARVTRWDWMHKSLSECKEVKHAVSGFDFLFIYLFIYFFKSTHRSTGKCTGERVNVKDTRRSTKPMTELAFSVFCKRPGGTQQNMWKRVPGTASYTKTHIFPQVAFRISLCAAHTLWKMICSLRCTTLVVTESKCNKTFTV